MLKQYQYSLGILGAIVVLCSGITSAQNQCLTCGSTAPALQAYFDMTTKVMGAIQTAGAEGSSVGQYTVQGVPGLFGGGIVDISEEQSDIITKSTEAIGRNINQKLQATFAVTTILFTNIRDIGRDNILGLSILVQNQAIVRDRTKLQNIGSLMQDKIYELALAGAWQFPITAVDKIQIEATLKSYQDKGFVEYYQLTPSITYANLIFIFQKLSRNFEQFLADERIKQFSYDSVSADESVVRMNRTKIQQMKEDYGCARFGDQCAGSLKQFGTDIKAITSENIQASKIALKDVKDSLIKFRDVFGALGKQTSNFFKKREKNDLTDAEKKALSREDQLLRIIYGSDFKKIQNQQGIGASDIKKSVPSVGAESAISKTTNKPEEFITTDLPKIVDLPDPVKTTIAAAMSSSYADAQRAMQSANIVEPTNITIYIPLLAFQLQTLRELIGTKDTKGMLLYNLGTACELQCSNAGGTCW